MTGGAGETAPFPVVIGPSMALARAPSRTRCHGPAMTEPDITLESPAAPARLAELHENLAAATFGCDRIHIEIQNEGACRLF